MEMALHKIDKNSQGETVLLKKKAAILSSNNKIISNLTLSLRDRGDDIENITASPFFSLIFSDLSDIFLFLSFKGTKEGI